MENLRFIHNTVIHWIDKTDTKANIILAIKLFILGYFLKEFNFHELDKIKNFVLPLYFLSTISSFFFIIKIVYPKLSTGEATSLLYFKHISDKYRFNVNQGITDYEQLTDEKAKKDLITQIISLSVVATGKYKDLQKGIIFLMLEIILLMILFL